jgi:hypothetical protein
VEINEPKSVKPKMRGCKLRSGVNWQGALKQKGIKQMCVKQHLGVFFLLMQVLFYKMHFFYII